MKFSEAWLRDCVETELSRDQLLSRLTMAGLEVDGVEPVAQIKGPFVVGSVITVTPHPNADRLRLCDVDIAQPQPLKIVCGAPNVQEGARVVVALEGAQTAQGLCIKPSKIRGEASQGMLVSEQELGLADQSDGLLLLDDSVAVGTNFIDWLKLDDVSIEVDLTPNRGDCLSVRGIAREVSALTGSHFEFQQYADWPQTIATSIPVTLCDPRACPVYRGCLIENVDQNALTPLWMKEQLRRSGIRSISPLVDITNYVLLELGQPLHAFDAQCLKGSIQVGWAHNGQSLALLDEKQITLSEKDLIIADDSGPIALAGVMGGASTAVSAQTKNVFLECAFFSPKAIAGRARYHGLHTDASHRFERGIDPSLQAQALRRAVALVLEIAGGQAGPEVVVENLSALPIRRKIKLSLENLENILDMSFSLETVTTLLTGLGCEVAQMDWGWQVSAPAHRFDLKIEEDLIEEVARLVGYDQLPESLPSVKNNPILGSEQALSNSFFQRLLADLGYHEIISYSFVSEKLQDLLEPNAEPLKLKNPISSDMSVMRTSLWPGLVRAALYNQNRRHQSIRLFEIGQVFNGTLPTTAELSIDQTLNQSVNIGGVWLGDAMTHNWVQARRGVDFYDLKGSLESFLGACGHQSVEFLPGDDCVLHPGQSAKILINGEHCGRAGRLHPSIEKALGFESAVYVFELPLDKIKTVALPSFKSLSRFPAVRRDLAVVVAESVSAKDIQSCIVDCCGGLLKELVVFDVFRGGSIPEGSKSLAVGLVLQSLEGTLSEEVVNQCIDRILEKLSSEFNAELRQ